MDASGNKKNKTTHIPVAIYNIYNIVYLVCGSCRKTFRAILPIDHYTMHLSIFLPQKTITTFEKREQGILIGQRVQSLLLV
jgi:hypothetical protein